MGEQDSSTAQGREGEMTVYCQQDSEIKNVTRVLDRNRVLSIDEMGVEVWAVLECDHRVRIVTSREQLERIG
jgi:hypothetical protein